MVWPDTLPDVMQGRRLRGHVSESQLLIVCHTSAQFPCGFASHTSSYHASCACVARQPVYSSATPRPLRPPRLAPWFLPFAYEHSWLLSRQLFLRTDDGDDPEAVELRHKLDVCL